MSPLKKLKVAVLIEQKPLPISFQKVWFSNGSALNRGLAFNLVQQLIRKDKTKKGKKAGK